MWGTQCDLLGGRAQVQALMTPHNTDRGYSSADRCQQHWRHVNRCSHVLLPSCQGLVANVMLCQRNSGASCVYVLIIWQPIVDVFRKRLDM